jgi:hypothetical protein
VARIRTIKPDFWTDETVGECSPTARLLFIGTWNIADDYGNLQRSSKQIKAQLFPYDEIDCEALIKELISKGLVVEYESEGKKYLHIKGFDKHQKVEKKSQARFPIYEESGSTLVVLPEPSPTSSGSSLGREGKGRESALAEARTTPGLNLEAWDRWLTYRAERKPAIKACSAKEAAQELASYGDQQLAVVKQSIAQQWQGLFQLKAIKQQGPSRSAEPPRTVRMFGQ